MGMGLFLAAPAPNPARALVMRLPAIGFGAAEVAAAGFGADESDEVTVADAATDAATDVTTPDLSFGSSSSSVVELSVDALGSFDESPFEPFTIDFAPIEKFLDTNIVVRIAPFNFLLALNFFKQSTVSCLWKTDATRSRWQIHGCFKASSALILFAGFTVNIWFIRFLASGVTVSHSGEGKS